MTLQYKNHLPGSVKGYVHKVYDERGAEAARKEGVKRGAKLTSVYNFIGEFRAADLAKKSARKAKAANGKVAKKAKPLKAAKKAAAKKAPKAATKPAKAPSVKKPRTPKPSTTEHVLHG